MRPDAARSPSPWITGLSASAADSDQTRTLGSTTADEGGPGSKEDSDIWAPKQGRLVAERRAPALRRRTGRGTGRGGGRAAQARHGPGGSRRPHRPLRGLLRRGPRCGLCSSGIAVASFHCPPGARRHFPGSSCRYASPHCQDPSPSGTTQAGRVEPAGLGQPLRSPACA
jgi:hypothetical protein